MEDTIDLKVIVNALKKRMWLIIIITVILTGATAIINYFFLTPIYEAKTEVIVNQAKSEQQMYSANEIQTNLQLVSTYTGIIKSPVVLDKVKEKLEVNNELSGLRNQIRVVNEDKSQIITIIVENSDPLLAVKVANETAEVFQTEVVNIMNVDNVSILAKAEANRSLSPVKPNPTVNILIALVTGIMISSVVAFIMEYMDKTIKTEDDIERLLEQSVLGVVSTHIQPTIKGYKSQTKSSNSSVRSESIGS